MADIVDEPDDFIDGEQPAIDPAQRDSDAAVFRKQQEDELAAMRAARLRLREAYVRVFAGAPAGDDVVLVMDDLRNFCRGEETAWHDSERIHCLLTGRQEVFQRIADHTRLSADVLWERYAPRQTRQ